MTTTRRTAAAAVLLSLGLVAVGLPGCSGNSNNAAQPTPTTPAAQRPGHTAGMPQPIPAPPGVKTGDFTGGRK